jgi:hypothetical protein
MAQVRHGDRVRHQTWTDDNEVPLAGTVYLFPDAPPGTAGGEVHWDGYVTTTQLELVVDQLSPA